MACDASVLFVVGVLEPPLQELINECVLLPVPVGTNNAFVECEWISPTELWKSAFLSRHPWR